jgi:hypothetical protein
VPTQTDLLEHLWREVINRKLDVAALHRMVAMSKRRPDDPFADTGAAIERLLSLGASARDIGLIQRHAAYEAVFQTLYALNDPGVDDGDVFMLHERLLTADPSGREGRPGSADAFNKSLERTRGE